MINRRTFIKNTSLITAGVSVLGNDPKDIGIEKRAASNKILNAYYFRAHMYTIVPRHIREDLKWMAGIGTDAVSIAILEQDFTAAVENINIICNEAEKLGMKVFAVPSRWGGMFAGAPKVPSLFSVLNPQTWVLQKNGKPDTNISSGVISSVHYPETFEFFTSSLDQVFKLWNIKGIVWDEPKSFMKDYSAKAIEKLGADASLEMHVKAVVAFYSAINEHVKKNYPTISTTMFGYANLPGMVVDEAAKTNHLDYFGCDGRPWRKEDGGKPGSPGKLLLGEEFGERFLKAAKSNNKKSIWLIENHNLLENDLPLVQKRMPEVLAKGVDQLIYYYYPRNIQNPDKCMNALAAHLKKFK